MATLNLALFAGHLYFDNLMPDLLHASLIPYPTSFLARFYLEGLFPDTWQEFTVSETDYWPDSDIEFCSPTFRLQINALTGTVNSWRLKDYRELTQDWEELQRRLAGLTMDSEDYVRIELPPSPPNRVFLFLSHSGNLSIASMVDPQNHELSFHRTIRPYNDIYDIGFKSSPYNLAYPRIGELNFSPDQAKQIALYTLTNGKAKTYLPLFQKTLKDEKSDAITLVLSMDMWLSRRYAWSLGFVLTSVYIDSSTGEFINSSANPRWIERDYDEEFGSDTDVLYPKPSFAYAPYRSEVDLKGSQKDYCRVYFNGYELNFASRTPDLHFPPLRRDDTSVIFADYFPSFLIDVKRDGANIVLQGQLPHTGHKAELIIGSPAATLDGQLVTLSAPPEEFEGRLYLPYELLNLCNGVSTTFEPRENMLYVDTSHLRHPDALIP